MDEIFSTDIDNKLDWLFAETLIDYLKNKTSKYFNDIFK